MSIKDYIERHAAFRTDELLSACGDTRTNRNLLARAVSVGNVDRVRNGVYASRCGRFKGLPPDKWAIAAKLFVDPVYCYQTALELHGRAHFETPRLLEAYSNRAFRIKYHGITFRSWNRPNKVVTTWVGVGKVATSHDMTFVDCLERPDRACGIESVLRSVPSLTLQPSVCIDIAQSRSDATLRKVGCVLELLGYGESFPEELAFARSKLTGTSYTRLGKEWEQEGSVFDSRWRVYLPRRWEEYING